MTADTATTDPVENTGGSALWAMQVMTMSVHAPRMRLAAFARGDVFELSEAIPRVRIVSINVPWTAPELRRVATGSRLGTLVLAADAWYRPVQAIRQAQRPCLGCDRPTRYEYDAATSAPATSVVCSDCYAKASAAVEHECTGVGLCDAPQHDDTCLARCLTDAEIAGGVIPDDDKLRQRHRSLFGPVADHCGGDI